MNGHGLGIQIWATQFPRSDVLTTFYEVFIVTEQRSKPRHISNMFMKA